MDEGDGSVEVIEVKREDGLPVTAAIVYNGRDFSFFTGVHRGRRIPVFRGIILRGGAILQWGDLIVPPEVWRVARGIWADKRAKTKSPAA